MDSITIREIPPLCRVWTPVGQPARIPIIGSHHKQVLSGVINILTGTWLSYVSPSFNQGNFQELLSRIRASWRGWHIVMFLDKHSAHRASTSQTLAKHLGIELRWLPTACPELNVVDCLWRHVRDEVLANEPCPQLHGTVARAISYLDDLSPYQRLTKAGVLSDAFWLADVRRSLLSK
jgi:hypothetical protein